MLQRLPLALAGMNSCRVQRHRTIMTSRQDLQEYLNQSHFDRPELKILEAGCGSGSVVRMPDGMQIVGIDISAEELEINELVGEKIVGDIQEYDIGEETFDMIICWDVLEHLPRPDAALSRFGRAIRPGGAIVLGFPNVRSIKAKVAKHTPHRFHEWIYRQIYGDKYGQPGIRVFPTYLAASIRPDNIERFSRETGLKIAFSRFYESGVQRRFRDKLRISNGLAGGIDKLVKGATFDRASFVESDCIYVLEKPAQ